MFLAIFTTLFFLSVTASQKIVPVEPLPVCGMYEEFRECGSACQTTCATLFMPRVCSDVCVIGCFCQNGYVRAMEDGPCVREMRCRISPLPPMPVCGENEEYAECGSACPLTCEDDETKPRACPDICKRGCVCKEGFVRVVMGGSCIPRDGCKVAA